MLAWSISKRQDGHGVGLKPDLDDALKPSGCRNDFAV
jgi:hypothetical protein